MVELDRLDSVIEGEDKIASLCKGHGLDDDDIEAAKACFDDDEVDEDLDDDEDLDEDDEELDEASKFAKQKIRDRVMNPKEKGRKPKAGSGGFARCVKSVMSKKGFKPKKGTPKEAASAICAEIGRVLHGQAAMTRAAKKGRKG